jgi:hypothetical protein
MCELIVPSANNFQFRRNCDVSRQVINEENFTQVVERSIDSDNCLLYSQPLIIMFLSYREDNIKQTKISA